jgi:hypothetical protein
MLDRVFFLLQVFMSRFLYFIYPNNIIKLKNQREELSKDIREFISNNLGEYEKDRILFKEENGQEEKNILIKRNSGRKTSKDISNELTSIFS